MKDVRGATAVVCGAGSGIGRAIALSLGRRGAKVLLADRVAERLESVAQDLAALGAQSSSVQCDAALDDFADHLEAGAKKLGPVDILVNNIGVLSGGHFEDIPPEEWLRILNINVMAMVRAIHRFLPGMIERERGHIVNTASFSALYPYAYDRTPYAASKAAVVTMSEQLRLYLDRKGVGVTLLCPGPVKTAIGETARSFTEGTTRRAPPFPLLDPEEVGEMVAQAIADNRFFLPTNSDVVPFMVERASNLDAMLQKQAEAFACADAGLAGNG